MTTLTGKDSPLETTIEKIEKSLQKFGLKLKAARELNPVPHCFSHHLQADGYDTLYTNGKGTSGLASRASGMAEFVERLSTDFFFSDYYLGNHPDKDFSYFPDEIWFPVNEDTSLDDIVTRTSSSQAPLLSPELLEIYDGERELEPDALFDNNFDDRTKGICALPFVRIDDGQKIYFPISLLNNLYVSNGMAAGNSEHESQAQALSEIIERHVKNIVIAEGLALPEVPDDALAPYPHIAEIKANIEQHGFRVSIHDSSLGGTFPVICVSLVDVQSGGCYAAFGANCRFEIAIERTLTELLQGRQLDQLSKFQPPSHNLELVADSYNLESHFIDSDGLLAWSMFKDEPDFPFSPWSFSGTTEQEKNQLASTIRECGFDIYQREYRHCGFYACRILVPGMSEIYPPDDLIWNNRNKGAGLRPQLLRMADSNEQERETLLNHLEEEAYDDMQLVSHITGLLFDKGSNWDTLRIGELKAHLLLASGREDEALVWCNWVVDYADLPQPRKSFFRAVATLLELESKDQVTDYEKGLKRFFSDQEIETAKAVVCGSAQYHGLHFAPSWEELSKAHNGLLQLYKKLSEKKAEHY